MRLARFLFLLCTLALCPANGSAAGVPLTLGGITLGQDISKYRDICLNRTDSVIREEPHLNEVNIDPDRLDGIINGKIAYANCGRVGKIVRVKFRFACPERSLFELLRKRYKDRFGDPSEWRGDPFKNVLSWKWSIRDDAGNRVSLVLSHSRDEDYNTLNAVKMTLRSLWEEAYSCMRDRDGTFEKRTGNLRRNAHQIDVDLFTPK
jgi:hypothetical protein